MSRLLVEKYSNHSPPAVPRLFSETHDFRFLNGNGCLTHHSLPSGPKGYRVVAVASTGHEASFVEQARIALTIPLSGTAQVRIDGRSVVVRPGDVFAIGPSHRHSRLKPDRASMYRSFTIISPVQAGWPRIDQEGWFIRRRYREYPQLKGLLGWAFKFLGDGTAFSSSSMAALEALVDDMFWAVCTLWIEHSAHRLHLNGYDELVRRAREYMRGSFGQPLSMPQIAGALGVNARTLQAAFRNRCGRTPWQVLSDIRIEEMRTRLLTPGPGTSVTSAATDAGLLHLGRASKAYRERYGELPSTTLRRSRQGPVSGARHVNGCRNPDNTRAQIG